ncbi:MBL fold metallo-hydrolase [Candidatus Gracilibacteria bacterium]|nr:MBL fold metallo-hydrolase [Candidatus Gracilibacteria bacterium]
MKIEFAGATKEVTGSKHLLHINGKKILLDCGLFQGRRKESINKNIHFPFDASSIDTLVLSHAHIDHSGSIPLLVKNGFTGPIYCTHATRDLCSIMLRDSAYIQEREAKWLQKKNKNEIIEPLYTIKDAEKAISLFRSVSYHQKIRITQDINVTFHDAGHILGSSIEEWEIFDHDTKQKIRLGFTGDLGRKTLPILKDREQLENLDVLLSESTYGDRLHDEILKVEDKLAKEINETYERGGKILIPAFAVERTQEILFVLRYLRHKNKIPVFPIFIDSPLAVNATEIFQLHPECFDEEMNKLLEEGKDPFADNNGVQFIQSVEESKALNKFPGSAIIISASGMCEFGRIRHHLANNISDEKNLLLIVGWMAQNTLGRKLLEGENPINLFGKSHNVKIETQIYNAFSGHADQKGLLDFAQNTGTPKNVFLVHGEISQQNVLKQKMKDLENMKNTEIIIPEFGDIYELNTDGKFFRSHEVNHICKELVKEPLKKKL